MWNLAGSFLGTSAFRERNEESTAQALASLGMQFHQAPECCLPEASGFKPRTLIAYKRHKVAKPGR